ncbi:MAG: PilZ domain-containing protein [Thermodesulfobacteriota bacterium]
MTGNERRRFPRYDTEIAVMIHKDNEEIPATMIDISEGGIGIISDRGFFPGAGINITLKYIDDYSIHGTVKWANLVSEDGGTQYRIGIEADSILIESDGDTFELPARSEFIKRLLSDPGK